MAAPKLEPAFSIGEVSPDLFGRFDLARMSVAASTMRNFQVHYTGGALSRGGTKFVGFSKQTGREYPPRLIGFQFNINQGIALEFGNFYMRPIIDGAFVTEPPLPISAINQNSPAQVTSSGDGVTSAVSINGGVLSSYAPGDTITIAGGTYLTPALLSVSNTTLLSVLLNNPGSGVYAPGDGVNLAGGTQTSPVSVLVATTQVISATVAAGGAAGTDGTQTVTGTTGTGTKFQASVTVAGGTITAVLAITLGGSYTVNPTAPANEPVTGAGLVGAQLNVSIGILTFTIFNHGVFTTNAPGGTFTQASTTGTGTGATFQQGVFGPNTLAVSDPGVYSVVPPNPASQLATSGTGLGATFTLTTGSVASFEDGDWVQIAGVVGMTEVNGQIYVIDNSTPTTFDLYDVYGNPIDSTTFNAYVSGGTVARLYTVGTPYSERDLQFLKFVQSKDVMSICCVNQNTLTEYPTYDLERNGNTDWRFVLMDPESSVDPPTAVSGSASAGGSTFYKYVVTSIDPNDGSESIASDTIEINNAVNIGATAGSITLTWTPQPGVSQQNVYKALPAFNATPPPGSQFGFAGFAFGAQFKDSNITPDLSQVPPRHKNPFARGQVLGANAATGGTGYTTATITINTATGSGAELEPVIVGGSVVAYLLIQSGQNYADGDTISITGDGTGATAILRVGATSGTYPGTVSYDQQRRVYGYSLEDPDTLWFSQPGAFKNFDFRIPTIDSDAITSSPWSMQVNGVQFMVPMPGGLVVLTGLDAWQLTGQGGSSLNPQPITPSTQQAQPQAFNGCHSHIAPIKIDYDILYVQSKGSVVRDLSYQFYTNIYTGADLTVNSTHLFSAEWGGREGVIEEWAWCEEPYKTVWAVRGDGAFLSLAFLKPQEINGWTRHDTDGLVRTVCSIVELPVDALYLGVKRTFGTNTAYTIERMDPRVWSKLDDAWCVDCGLRLDQPKPDATLIPLSASGLGAVTGVAGLVSGDRPWSANTTASVVDDNGQGPGTGAVPVLTIAGGTITAISFPPGQQGSGYLRPRIVVSDPAGSQGGDPGSFSCTCVLDNTATFEASAPIFQLGDMGAVIRAGGGVAVVTGLNSPTEITVNIEVPLTDIQPNSRTAANPQGQVRQQPSGAWTMTQPVNSVSGGQHLAGAIVTGLADGVEIPPQVMPASGVLPLPQPSTAVTVGRGFTAQLQSVYLDGGEPTIQGQRKKVAAVTVRVRNSHDFEVGTNQVDGSTLSPQVLDVEWEQMTPAVVPSQAPFGSAVRPLYSGDLRVGVKGGIDLEGQVAIQQSKPYPVEILALIPETLPGDTPSIKVPERQRRQPQQAAA